MAKNFPNLIEDINLQILNVQWTPDKGKTKKKIQNSQWSISCGLYPGNPIKFLTTIIISKLWIYFCLHWTNTNFYLIENTIQCKKHHHKIFM